MNIKSMKQGTTSARRVLSTLLAMMLTVAVFAQKETVSGTVVDSQNEPIIGASVMEIGTQNGVATDIDGHFTMSVK